MYKDVWKRILAVMVVVCMVVTVVEWPQTAKAETAKTYHTYQYGDSESAGFVTGNKVAAVFQTNQNESGGAEIFEGISFDLHFEEGTDPASVMVQADLYTSPNSGNPASGTFVCSNEAHNLTEGTNKLSFASLSTKLMYGECFSIVLTVQGEGASFYAQQSTETWCTFTEQENGNWHDTSEDGQTIAIRAITYDEGMLRTESGNVLKRVATALSTTTDEKEDDIDRNNLEEIASSETTDENETILEEQTSTDQNEVTTEGDQTGTNQGEDESDAEETIPVVLSDEKDPSLNQASISLGVGESYDLQLYDLPANATCAWNVDDGSILAITPNGSADAATSATVTGLTEGSSSVNVKVTKEDGTIITLSCAVKVLKSVSSFEITLEETNYTYDGQAHQPAVTVRDGEQVLTPGSDYSVQYENDTAASTVENPAKAIVTGMGSYVQQGQEVLYTIAPKNINDIDELEVGTDITEGTDLDIAAHITLRDLGQTLSKDKDYTFGTYDTTTGTHKVTVTGIGNYTGNREVEYTIRKSIADAQIDVQTTSAVYTGKEIRPSVTVKLGDALLTQDVDYTVSYSNNINAGTVNITVNGKGSYCGEANLATFTIVQKNLSNSDNTASSVELTPDPLPIAARKGTAEASAPEFTLMYNGSILVQGIDYTISVQAADGGTWSETTTEATLTITGNGNFTGSITRNFKLGTDIAEVIDGITIASGTYVYNGKEQTPEITVNAKAGYTLTEGTDYEIAYGNNIDAGTAEVCIKGIGAYGGMYDPNGTGCSATFEIEKVSLASIDESCFVYEKSLVYSPNADEMKPPVAVSYGGSTLDKSSDYSLTYTGSLQVGENQILVKATDSSKNFTGEKQLSYNITSCPITGSNIAVAMTRDYKYTGEAIIPEINSIVYTDQNGAFYTLKENVDYKLVLSDNVNYGNKTVQIDGINNYSGFRTENYTISRIELNTLKLTVTNGLDDEVKDSYRGTYKAVKKYQDGRKITLDIVMTHENETLIEGTDYDVDYNNNWDMSKDGATAEAVIEGKGNYTGKITVPFLIYKDIADCNITGVNGSMTYTGDPITFSGLKVADGFLNTLKLQEGVDFVAQYSENSTDVTGNTDAILTIAGVPTEQLPTTNGCYVGSVEKPFSITPLSLSDIPEECLSVSVKEKYYEGTAVTLNYNDITMKYTTPAGNVMTLNGGTDYTLGNSYNNNEKVTDNAETSLLGAGNFTGSKLLTFKISGKSMDNKDIAIALDANSFSYTGEEIKPVVTVTDKGLTLAEGTDYTLTYKNNVNAGKASVTIAGTGNYSGAVTKTFTILPLSLQADGTTEITGVKDPMVYLPGGVTQNPTVYFTATDNSKKKLVEGTDYTLSYQSNDKVGRATLVVTGKGNYAGSQTRTFTINQAEIIAEMIEMKTVWPFTGQDIVPPVKVTYEGYELKQGQGADYTVTYENNYAVGDDAKAIITGEGNFTGTVTIPFRITDSIEDDNIEILCDANGKTFVYTGSAIEPSVTVRKKSTQENLIQNTDYKVTYKNQINKGTATILVEGMGNYAGSREFSFSIEPKPLGDADVSATPEKSSFTYTGAQIAPSVKVTFNGKTLEEGSDYTKTYGENINAGTGTIELKGINNFNGSKTVTFAITAKSIGSGNAFATGFSMDQIETQGYSGSPISPTPGVHYKEAGVTTDLVYGTDYTFEYANNIEVGTAQITVNGTGNYTGSVRQTFAIRDNIESAEVVVKEANYEDYQASGKVTPEPVVTLRGIKLVKNTDYTLAYHNNTKPGTATVTIQGAGNYGGKIEKEFTIYGDLSKADVEPIGGQAYTGTAITPEPVVTYHGTALQAGGVDYTVSYSDNTNVGEATITLVGSNYYRGTNNVKFKIIPAQGNFVISEIAAQRYCGKQIKPEVKVTYDEKLLTAGKDYILSYGSNTDAGLGTVTVTGAGDYVNVTAAVKTFTISPLSMSELTLSDSKAEVKGTIADQEYTGSAILPTNIVLTYEENGTKIYTLTANDFETTCTDGSNTEIGMANIVIAAKGNNIVGSREESFNIVPKDISGVNYTITGSSASYTGAEITPKVTLRNGQTPMDEGIDYTIEYFNNINAGTAEIKLVGIGNYTGERTEEFKITALPISNGKVTVADIPTQIYTGTAIMPELSLTYTDAAGNDMILVADTDYTVTYSANTKVGTASALVKGKGNFSGQRTARFTIGQKDISAEDVLVEKIPNQAYDDGNPVVPPVTITYGTYTLKQNTDYILVYANNKEIGTATITINGKGNFSGQKTATFEIASGVEHATITGLKTAYTYTGLAIEPEGVTVKIGETLLKAETDYTISYENNVDVGNATLIITGAGNYGGVCKAEFEIIQKDISEKDVVLNGFKEQLGFNGEAVEQKVTLTYGTITLKTPEDYTVQYISNDAIGTAQMILTGTGNYTGSITKQFAIVQRSVADENLKIDGDWSSTYTYTGEEIRPNPTLSIDGVVLKAGEDYELSYTDNVNVGVAKMVITGKNGFGGVREMNYMILGKSVSGLSYGSIAKQIYNGSDVKPTVTVSDNGRVLTPSTDYTLMYSNNGKPGTASAVIMGVGNYTATKTLKFDIGPGGITGIAVTQATNSSVSLEWTGDGLVTGFEVYRADGNGKYKLIARKKGKSCTDTELTSDQTYSYKVRAYLVTEGVTYYSDFSKVVEETT